ncbi:alpha/beta hydrolase [Mycobacterium sp. Y57]|uniref:alpha/beta fold hydrolase n=1 Tax=Mycolicibacterium xanthum TaxID=2796469 RepID=UPI001C84B92D|nr:alpha/beta hydrolase [Mycolicibacterium xanthum]MBX7431858.1 alpha/beta hydrolase [Mycolicibacterium xanthum]
MESFDFRGLPISYEHTGQGEPVIMLHNGGSSHAIWEEVANRLAGKYEIFALDLLGFGDSAKPGAGYTLDNYVAMLEEFVSSRALDKVALVGNCMGSAISLAFADRHPDRVKALVLCNPLTESTFLGGWLGPFLWIRERLPALNRQVYRLLGQLKLTNGIGSVATLFQLGPRGRALKLYRKPELAGPYAATGQVESLLGVLDDLENYSVIDNLAPPQGFPPICTIWGLKNKMVSPKAGRRLDSILHAERRERLPDCGHLLMLERPDEVASIIDGFLQSAVDTPA